MIKSSRIIKLCVGSKIRLSGALILWVYSESRYREERFLCVLSLISFRIREDDEFKTVERIIKLREKRVKLFLTI